MVGGLRRRRRPRTGAANGRRLAWRYRRQLAPVLLILGAWLAGAVLHRVHNGPRLVLVLGGLAAASVLLPAVRRRLDRAAERLYAGACLAALTGWLTVVAASGVGRPMPALLWLGGCALAAPWWWHHRVRTTPAVATGDVLEIWRERVAAPGRALPGARLLEVEEVRNGWAATIQLTPGEKSTEQAVAATALVCSAFNQPIGSVVIEPTADGVASRARLLVLRRNPLHDIQRWPGPQLDLGTGIAPVGVYADGELAYFRFFKPGSGAVHALVSGTTGSGKSRFLELLLAEARHSGLITSWIIDPQNGQSLPRWIDHVDWAAIGHDEAIRLLHAARAVMYARSAHLARVEYIDRKGRTVRGIDHFDPTPELPLLQVVVDEAHVLLKDPTAVEIIEDIGKMGRKTGIGVVLVTPVPSVQELGGSLPIRTMVSSGNVVVFRCDNLSGQMAFSGALPVSPAKLPREFPNGLPADGLGYLLGASSRTAPMRAYLVDDPYHWATTGQPAQLAAVDVAAAGDAYASRNDHVDEPVTIPSPRTESPPPAAGSAATAVDAVLTLLAEVGELDRGRAIKDTGYSPRQITNAFAALVEDGRVVKTGHGRYTLAGADSSPAAVM
ncbi:MAG TPA: hypothetical protein VGJ95_24075 [Pseudonocardiaceae bacterium]